MTEVLARFQAANPTPEGVEYLPHYKIFASDNDTPLCVADMHNARWETWQKALAELGAEVKALKEKLSTHPCVLEDWSFDHNWKFIDDSFDHEYGTEVVHYFECRDCKATKDVEGDDDCTIDRGG